jgi:Domain of unknown function (DUF1992)
MAKRRMRARFSERVIQYGPAVECLPMTERKPAGTSWESWIDSQIRVAQEQGAFDNLPGAGKPLPNIDQEYDPLW